ncbi:hypothetical protein EYZ11_000268 [Aspergillus tanneri]|uniref:Uncharacterized protein n=1 Tax=Aspergillus tanneri TaxID=1220188 RepID=A0A4S3JXN7_9EURO|nr:uncharacterized protein ATNIH1004_007876 [Aspergillus tanneri]KAA8646446.1 hypothetical protein ATNIH1004_007876 [Aspergillus tanneri]THD00218.1 hypothetical protein EYZ11_000268 [Aspergillus tanneri]
MATLGGHNGPWADRYNSMLSMAKMVSHQLCICRVRSRPTRALFLAVATFFALTFLLLRSPAQQPVNYWLKYPSYRPSQGRPEDAQVVPTSLPSLRRNDTLPSSLQKSNPSFHFVIPATQKSASLCRMLTSAMILNYPPPTLVSYGKDLPKGSRDYDTMVDRVSSIYKFLAYTPHIQDSDFVLIADGTNDFFFQLPPELMIQRFQSLLRDNNAKLRDKYGLVTVERPSGPPETVQKYSQRVLFSASKACLPILSNDAGCVSVPQSSLPPDAYGWKTDVHSEGHLNRPRWIKPGAAIGQVADLKPIYAELMRYAEQHRNVRGDYVALTQLFGRQEYVRELERRRTSSSVREWLYHLIGISDATNITKMRPRLETGQRYEYGIGLDYESRLFFNMLNSQKDVEWLQYNNISKTSAVQMQHGVPRERRLLLPADLASEKLKNPFTQPKFGKNEWVNPPLNGTLDTLPSTRNHSWRNIPLMTNVHSANVPALVHLDGDPMLRDTWWSKMWYYKWARALLRKSMRAPTGFDAAQSALLGGQDWWDLRGGRGGLWTDKGEWIDYAEVCTGYERDLFNDDQGTWGKESGDSSEEPIYNQFGNLVKGKGH